MTRVTLYKRFLKNYPHRTAGSIERHIIRLKAKKEGFRGLVKPEEKLQQTLRIGYLDIEATQLTADWGHLLSWYIKPKGQKRFHKSVITPREIQNIENPDRRLLDELLIAFKEFDVIYAHYGGLGKKRFDTRFILGRFAAHGMIVPDMKRLIIRDTYDIFRRLWALSSFRLDSIAQFLQVKYQKTPLQRRVWRMATRGHAKSIKYIDEHNKYDVLVLEECHKRAEYLERKGFPQIG